MGWSSAPAGDEVPASGQAIVSVAAGLLRAAACRRGRLAARLRAGKPHLSVRCACCLTPPMRWVHRYDQGPKKKKKKKKILCLVAKDGTRCLFEDCQRNGSLRLQDLLMFLVTFFPFALGERGDPAHRQAPDHRHRAESLPWKGARIAGTRAFSPPPSSGPMPAAHSRNRVDVISLHQESPSAQPWLLRRHRF